MIDNRPKTHRINKTRSRNRAPEPEAVQAVIHNEEIKEIPPIPAAAPVRVKKASSSPLGGLGKLLGGLGGGGGLLGGLGGGGGGGLLGGLGGGGSGGLLGGLGGGGLGTVLPVVLAVSALQRGRGAPRAAQACPVQHAQAAQTIAVEEPKPEPEVAAASSMRSGSSRQVRRKTPGGRETEPAAAPAEKPASTLKHEKAPPETAATPDPDPIPAYTPRPAPPPRPVPKPTDIKNLLNDLSGYLPGTGGASVTKISKIIGIADELKSIPNGGSVFASSAPADPMDRNIGLLNALGRNLPFSGASNLSKAGQVLSVVNTLKATTGGGGGGRGLGGLGNLGSLGGLGGLGGLGNLSNMAGMFSGAMGSQPASKPSGGGMKNVSPDQAEGLKNTVNRLLSGMDDKQKSDLLDKAKDFLGKK